MSEIKLPTWLEQKEPYEAPRTKKNALLTNQKWLQKLLWKLQKEGEAKRNTRFQPLVYWIALLVFVFLCCYSQRYFVIWGASLVLLACLLQLPTQEIITILKRSSVLIFVNLCFYLPAFIFDLGKGFFLVKSSLVIVAVMMYAQRTPIYDFLVALKQAHLPDSLIFQADIFVKHLHVLGDLLLQMLQAIEARSVGKAKKQDHLVGLLFGNLYLTLVQYGKDLYNALVARAFTGSYACLQQKLSWTDKVALLGLGGCFFLSLFL